MATLVSVGDKLREEWAKNSGDYAWQVLRFLQRHRRNEVSLSEILQTKTYARSIQREKDSLRFVAAMAEQLNPPSAEDARMLTERDGWLMKFVDGETLGHADLVAHIKAIPATVARAQEVDAAMFPQVYPTVALFSWVWKVGKHD